MHGTLQNSRFSLFTICGTVSKCGKVLDDGRNIDLVGPHAMPFGLAGDGTNHIADHLEIEFFDSVHSSHYCEHMRGFLEVQIQGVHLLRLPRRTSRWDS